MEEMNARVMENEVMDETVEVDEAVDSGNAGALVAGIVGGFLAYARDWRGEEALGVCGRPSWPSGRLPERPGPTR